MGKFFVIFIKIYDMSNTFFKICIGFGMRMDKFYASNLFDLKNISLENTSQKIYKV